MKRGLVALLFVIGHLPFVMPVSYAQRYPVRRNRVSRKRVNEKGGQSELGNQKRKAHDRWRMTKDRSRKTLHRATRFRKIPSETSPGDPRQHNLAPEPEGVPS